MKFCSKCGAELFDDAAICTKCGRMLEGAAQPSEGIDIAAVDKKQSMKVTVFNFVFAIMAVMTLFFLALSFVWARVYSDLVVGTYDIWVNSSFGLEDDTLIVAMIFSFASFAFGLVSFILTLVERLREEKLFRGIFNLVVGIVLPLFFLFAEVI